MAQGPRNGSRPIGPVPTGDQLGVSLALEMEPREGVRVYEAEWLIQRDGKTYVMEPDRPTVEVEPGSYIVNGRDCPVGLLDVVVYVVARYVRRTGLVTAGGEVPCSTMRLCELWRGPLVELHGRANAGIEALLGARAARQ